MVTLSLVWLLMEKQELWLVIAMMYLQKDNNQPVHLARIHFAIQENVAFFF